MMSRWLVVAFVSLILSCANTINVSHENDFKEKTGIIGVFRQPIGFCSGGYPQWMMVNGKKISVKPTWTSAQDNLFSAYFESGEAKIESYSYGCGNYITRVDFPRRSDLDEYPTLIIPQRGFCKIVVSLLKGEKMFQKNDDLLKVLVIKEKISVDIDQIPYCEVK